MTDAAFNAPWTSRFGPIERFAQIDSTNRYLLDRLRSSASDRPVPDGAVAVADLQTAGRGRLGRTWTAPPGGSLLVSVLVRPAVARPMWHLVTATAALAAIDAVRVQTHDLVVPRLKWPNDLVVGDRKLAGLLAEAEGDAVVLGMGLNLDWPSVPPELDSIATALNLLGVDPVPGRDALLTTWLARWHGWFTILEAPAGVMRVRAAVERASATLGQSVRVELGDSSFVGVALSTTDEGHLVVDCDGVLRTVSAGDVVHLRNVQA